MRRVRSLLSRLWLHVRLLQRWRALREQGVRVKRRGRLLVIDGRRPECPPAQSRRLAARRNPPEKSARAPAIQPNLLSPSSRHPSR
jgi:hypothetical protein